MKTDLIKKKFKEGLRLPLIPSLIASFVIGTILWMIMQKSLFGSVRFVVPPWPFLAINYVFPFLFINIFPMVNISVRRELLSVGFSMGKYCIENIPLDNILTCQKHVYKSSIWNMISPDYYQDDLKKIHLPGFSGDGVLLTYTKEKLLSGEKYTSRILIPTRKFEELSSVLNSYTTI